MDKLSPSVLKMHDGGVMTSLQKEELSLKY
jgi:hypothetical protein